MSFGEALGFPFKSENLPKILTIILTFTIIVAALLVLGLIANAFQLAILAMGLVSLAYSVFVSGYSIEVIRRVMEGDSVLPATDLGRDIKQGIVVVFAAFIYMLPIIILFACAFGFAGASIGMSYSGSGYSQNNGGESGILAFCGALLVGVGMAFFFGNALLVGMIRYAAEDRSGALYEFGQNFSYVTANFGRLMGLFVRSFGIGLIFGILSAIVSGMLPTTETLTVRGFSNIGTMTVVFFVIESVLTQSLSLMSQMSVAHLQARFGLDVGIYAGKNKNDEYKF